MYLFYLEMKGGKCETGDDAVEADADSQRVRDEVHVSEGSTA